MYNSLLLPDLREMLEQNDTRGLAEFCDALHSAVAAEVLEGLSKEDVWRVLSNCRLDRQVEIIEFMSLHRQAELVGCLDRERLSNLLQVMSPDDAVDLLEQMDEGQIERLLPLFAQAQRRDIRKLLSYPEGSAGSIMTTEYASLPEGITVGEALTQLRLQAPNSETIYYVYVVDAERRLRGFVSLRNLILARTSTALSDMMDRDVISVRVDDDQEQVAQVLARFDFLALPVTDAQNHLVGIVTHDDVLDVVQEEATEDAHRLGAVAPLDESYLETSLLTVTRKRVGWLVLLFASAFVTSHVLKHYQSVSEAYEWLIFFIPLVIASGGNAGSQTATLVIRTMALGEMTADDNYQLVRREALIGLMLGSCLAFCGFALSLWLISLPQAAVVSLTVGLIVFTGTMVGALLPVGVKFLGMDPALMSTPLIASVLDVCGLVLYYNVALLLLGGR
jgi:magnesium transporter